MRRELTGDTNASENRAVTTGCSGASFPFIYLGMPVGCDMNKCSNWEEMIQKVQKRLATWKVRRLSIGGRLTLCRSVLGSLGVYYMSLFKMPELVNRKLESIRSQFFCGGDQNDKKIAWVQWKKVLNSKEKGGLGIGSLKALNLALIQKWRWRFNMDKNGIWKKVITSVYGLNGGIGSRECISKATGVWGAILKSIHHMHNKNIVVYSTMKKKIGNGNATRFWMDVWVGTRSLKEQFPGVYAVESNKECMVSDRWVDDHWQWIWHHRIRDGCRTSQQFREMNHLLQHEKLSDHDDTWECSLQQDGSFSVACFRKHIDEKILHSGDTLTRWNKLVPIKVNILIWRLRQDRLATRENLMVRGIDMPSVGCPSCGAGMEDSDHIFVKCDIAIQIWKRIFRWIDMDQPMLGGIGDLFNWIDVVNVRQKVRVVLEAICISAMWVLWQYRNNVIFGDTKMKKSIIFDRIVSHSFEWCSSRGKEAYSNWTLWLQSPLSLSL